MKESAVQDRFLKRLRKKAKSGLRGWPVATIAFYGPNLSRASKVAVGIIAYEGAESEMRCWRRDPAIADPAGLVSNFRGIEWPRKSGKRLQVPEADRADWFTLDEARAKMNPAQTPFLSRLAAILARDGLTGRSG